MAKTENATPGDSPTKAVQAPKGSVRETANAGELLKIVERNAPDVLSGVPKDRREKLVSAVAAYVVSKTHCGPLPPPEDLAVYDQHIPGGADRIMKMAEKQSDHRIAIETRVISSQQLQSGLGQIFGLVIAVFGISSGAYVALQGHDAVGGVIAGTTVVSLVYAFISGQRAQRRDLERKAGK